MQVHGLHYVVNNVTAKDELLIVDDVHDTGLSIAQVIEDLNSACGENTPQIRIATPYYKPNNNKTGRVPEYYLYETDNWLVFPHELAGMSAKELLDNKPGVETLKALLSKKSALLKSSEKLSFGFRRVIHSFCFVCTSKKKTAKNMK